MLTDSASSSHRSERVQKKNTSPATQHRADRDHRGAARPTRSGRAGAVARARARRRARSWSQKVTPGGRRLRRGTCASAPDAAARRRARTLRGCRDDGRVAEPQHELATTRRRRTPAPSRPTCSAVPTKLSRTYSSCGDAAPQRAAAGRVEPLLHVGFGVEHAAVGTVRAHDRVEVAADLVAVLLEQPRLAHEPLDAGLPVGLVGVPRLDAQRDLLAAAADPDLGQLLDRLRVAVRAVERRGACPGT